MGSVVHLLHWVNLCSAAMYLIIMRSSAPSRQSQVRSRLAAGGRWIRTIDRREEAGLYCGGELGGIDREAKKFCGYRWFESISLQQRVRCELGVSRSRQSRIGVSGPYH